MDNNLAYTNNLSGSNFQRYKLLASLIDCHLVNHIISIYKKRGIDLLMFSLGNTFRSIFLIAFLIFIKRPKKLLLISLELYDISFNAVFSEIRFQFEKLSIRDFIFMCF